MILANVQSVLIRAKHSDDTRSSSLSDVCIEVRLDLYKS